MAHIGEKVRSAREMKKWTQRKLATVATGYKQDSQTIGESYLSRLERGEAGYTPDTENALAKALNLDVRDFHTESDGGVSLVTTVLSSGLRKFPVISFERAAEMVGQNVVFVGEENTNTVIGRLDHSPRSFAALVRGNAMFPDFKEGDPLIFDMDVKPEPGDLVLVSIGAEQHLRYYRPMWTDPVTGEATFELVPCDLKRHPVVRSGQSDVLVKIIAVMTEQTLGRTSRRHSL